MIKLALLIFIIFPLASRPESSYTWKLDLEMGKVMKANNVEQESEDLQETVLDILLSTQTQADGTWKKTCHCFPKTLPVKNNFRLLRNRP